MTAFTIGNPGNSGKVALLELKGVVNSKMLTVSVVLSSVICGTP
jgi:hypothetical protein